jgi:hypothetical protein
MKALVHISDPKDTADVDKMLALTCMAEYVYKSEVPAVFKVLEPEVVKSMCKIFREVPDLREEMLELMQQSDRLWKDVMTATITAEDE